MQSPTSLRSTPRERYKMSTTSKDGFFVVIELPAVLCAICSNSLIVGIVEVLKQYPLTGDLFHDKILFFYPLATALRYHFVVVDMFFLREPCEGDGDVVGVVTPLVRGGAQVLHGDQVVELSVLLEVHEREEQGEDGEGQIEAEREKSELKERRTWITMRMI